MRTYSGRRGAGRRGVLVAALGLSSLGACTSPPTLREIPVACVETIPAGARLLTADGEVLATPALVPCPQGESQRVELWLEGHAPRRVAIVPSTKPTRLAAFGACALLPLFSDGEDWERVQMVDGRIVLELEPLVLVESRESGDSDAPRAR